jgi:nitrogen regulation protein NR(I)
MTMDSKPKILLIEDDENIASSLQLVLGSEGLHVVVEGRGDSGLARAREETFDVVITDLKLPGLNGLELVQQLHRAQPHLPIILMTAHGTSEIAIEATKLGAYEYVVKPFEMEELIALVEQATNASRLMSEPVGIGADDSTHDAIVGNSRAMQSIYKEIGRIAPKPVTVLIRGETGTGKELIARAIYQHSERANAPFIAINCAAIPETLLESELFGHERGAFTGADLRRIGRFEQAHGGTIFLDEVGDMSPGTQAKLLRVLQSMTIQRLGGRETIPVDVRVIAATHCDLETAIQEKQFREDLFYRLNVASISLPPLRERREDIPDLIHFLIQKFAREFGMAVPSIQPAAIDLLQGQRWPGNVRELENFIRKLLLLTRGYPITAEHVREVAAKTAAAETSIEPSLRAVAAELLSSAERGEAVDIHARLLSLAERELITQAFELAQGNQAKAARWLGLSRLTLRQKLTDLGLRRNPPDVAP